MEADGDAAQMIRGIQQSRDRPGTVGVGPGAPLSATVAERRTAEIAQVRTDGKATEGRIGGLAKRHRQGGCGK